MKTYNINYQKTAYFNVSVEAANEEDAEAKFKEITEGEENQGDGLDNFDSFSDFKEIITISYDLND